MKRMKRDWVGEKMGKNQNYFCIEFLRYTKDHNNIVRRVNSQKMVKNENKQRFMVNKQENIYKSLKKREKDRTKSMHCIPYTKQYTKFSQAEQTK